MEADAIAIAERKPTIRIDGKKAEQYDDKYGVFRRWNTLLEPAVSEIQAVVDAAANLGATVDLHSSAAITD